MTDTTVTFTFTEGWEVLNAIEQRLEILGRHLERFPESDVLNAPIGRLAAARDKLRESMSLTDRIVADALIAAITEVILPDVPVASMDPSIVWHEYLDR